MSEPMKIHWSDYQSRDGRYGDATGTYGGFTGWVVDGHGSGEQMVVVLANADGDTREALASEIGWTPR